MQSFGNRLMDQILLQLPEGLYFDYVIFLFEIHLLLEKLTMPKMCVFMFDCLCN